MKSGAGATDGGNVPIRYHAFILRRTMKEKAAVWDSIEGVANSILTLEGYYPPQRE